MKKVAQLADADATPIEEMRKAFKDSPNQVRKSYTDILKLERFTK